MRAEERGIIQRKMISGPVQQIPLIIDTDEGIVSLDSLLRPFEGLVVTITINAEKATDAERERLTANSDSKYSSRRGRRDS